MGLLGLALLAAPLAAGAQQTGKVHRIGLMTFDQASGNVAPRNAFLQGLRDLGYVEGRNFVIESRDAEGKAERFPALAAELVALDVDVIVAMGGTRGALAAKAATTTVPIVFPAVGDPVADGIVSSLARPGGNVTGLAVLSPELIIKSMELLKQAVPGVRRVALLMRPTARPSTP
jgi:putative ABC transport system substrate-binding protein